MEFTNTESHLSLLYHKAKESFEWCIQNDGNEFLKDELSVPFDDIVLIEKDIKLYFRKEFSKSILLRYVYFCMQVIMKLADTYILKMIKMKRLMIV